MDIDLLDMAPHLPYGLSVAPVFHRNGVFVGGLHRMTNQMVAIYRNEIHLDISLYIEQKNIE